MSKFEYLQSYLMSYFSYVYDFSRLLYRLHVSLHRLVKFNICMDVHICDYVHTYIHILNVHENTDIPIQIHGY